MIIGRIDEKKQLEKIFNASEAEFVAVYGRRRVGKTFLIKEFFAEKECLFFQASGILKAAAAVQLKEFKKAVEKTFYSQFKATKLRTPVTWMEALEMLNEAIENLSYGQKVVLFLDEFPWMAQKKSQLLQALDYYWNHYWSNLPQVKLIICGSAASWIIDNILKNKGGLHNRVTLKLQIKPFDLMESQAYLKSRGISYNYAQMLQLYLCIGGIPYYLKGVEKGLSAMQNISQMCFQKTGALLDEFDNLFASLFNHHEEHEKIIQRIAKKREGVSRETIEEELSSKGGRLSCRLKELEEAGFIARYIPWGKKRGVYYKVIDEYTLFYLYWIQPIAKENISSEWNPHYWDEVSQSPAWNAWSGYAFEAICFKHVHLIRKALKIPEGAKVFTWRYIAKKSDLIDGAQIDLVFDRNDGIVNLCEIKYSKNAFNIDKEYALNLQHKAMIYQKVTQTKKQIFMSVITSAGLEASQYVSELIHSTATADDFFC